MAIVETERADGVMVVRMNRPERLNALSSEMRTELAAAWCEFRDSPDLEVGILTGTGRAFCAGEDMKESLEQGSAPAWSANAPASLRAAAGSVPPPLDNPYEARTLDKPVIAAINGYAMGGGFLLAEHADLRVAVRSAILEMSEAKRWLLGGHYHGFIGGLSHTVATEMAFAFRFPADRLHQLGWINRIADDADEMMRSAREMAAHLLTLPPASRVNTLTMMRAMRPTVPEELDALAERLRDHGAKSDLLESRRAFAEKRLADFTGWDDRGDRARTPTLESIRRDREGR